MEVATEAMVADIQVAMEGMEVATVAVDTQAVVMADMLVAAMEATQVAVSEPMQLKVQLVLMPNLKTLMATLEVDTHTVAMLGSVDPQHLLVLKLARLQLDSEDKAKSCK